MALKGIEPSFELGFVSAACLERYRESHAFRLVGFCIILLLPKQWVFLTFLVLSREVACAHVMSLFAADGTLAVARRDFIAALARQPLLVGVYLQTSTGVFTFLDLFFDLCTRRAFHTVVLDSFDFLNDLTAVLGFFLDDFFDDLDHLPSAGVAMLLYWSLISVSLIDELLLLRRSSLSTSKQSLLTAHAFKLSRAVTIVTRFGN